MDQMQAFIEKARNDKELMAKLDALGAGGAGAEPDKIVALAAEYGFSITEEDYRKANEQTGVRKTGELKEEDLEAVAGGATQNRYDPEICSKYTAVHYNCVGFLAWNWCDHYRREYLPPVSSGPSAERYQYTCVMGRYDYKGNLDAKPV